MEDYMGMEERDMKSNRIHFMGVPIDALTCDQTVDLILERIEKRLPTQHMAMNPGKIIRMMEDPEISTKIGVPFCGSANLNTRCDTTARFYAVKVQVKKGKEEPTTQIFCV